MTKREALAMKDAAASCVDCRSGVLLCDSLMFDLDREDEEQRCPALVHSAVPKLVDAYVAAMAALEYSAKNHSEDCGCAICEALHGYLEVDVLTREEST